VQDFEDGHDLTLVLHYESTFGRRRPHVIEALSEEIERQKDSIVAA